MAAGRGRFGGLLAILALAHCLSGALAGGAAPNASAGGEDNQKGSVFGDYLNPFADLSQIDQKELQKMKQQLNLLMKKKEEEDAKDPEKCTSMPKVQTCRVTDRLTEGCCAMCSNALWSANETKCLRDEVEWMFNVLGYVADHVGWWAQTNLAFFPAILLVLQWHVRFHFGEWLNQNLYSKWGWQPRQVKPFMLGRRLGLNILILGIYNNDDIPWPLYKATKDAPFSCSVALLFFDTVLLYYFFVILGYYVNPPAKLEGEKQWLDPVDEMEDDGRCPEKFEADNIYEDFTVKFRRAFPIFLAQIGLIMFYIKALNSNQDTHDNLKYKYGLWMVAVIFQVNAGDEQVGKAFNIKFWMHILGSPRVLDQCYDYIFGANWNSNRTREPLLRKQDRLKQALQKMKLPPRQVEKFLRRDITDEDVKLIEEISNKEYCNEDPEASATDTFFKRMNVELQDEFKRMLGLEESLERLGALPHTVCVIFRVKFELEWICRCAMDFLVNSVARTIILYTVPILVSVETPMDCVKDLTAVMFITTIDSISGNSKDLAEILAKLKYRYNYGIERRKAMGDDEAKTAKLNIFEKYYIQGHPDCFSQVDIVGGDAWTKFRLKGIPMSEEELEAELEAEEGPEGKQEGKAQQRADVQQFLYV